MKLIDADLLIDDCKRYLATLNPDRDGKECTRIHWLIGVLNNAPSINPDTPTNTKPEYTVKELNVFRHCVSIRLLSLRSAQHWGNDEETEKEIDFLEQLYRKVSAGIADIKEREENETN
jgi:hypothetical protein